MHTCPLPGNFTCQTVVCSVQLTNAVSHKLAAYNNVFNMAFQRQKLAPPPRYPGQAAFASHGQRGVNLLVTHCVSASRSSEYSCRATKTAPQYSDLVSALSQSDCPLRGLFKPVKGVEFEPTLRDLDIKVSCTYSTTLLHHLPFSAQASRSSLLA